MYQDTTAIEPGRSRDLSDAELLRAFEELTLPEDRFGHADHVRVAFLHLRRFGLLGALSRFPEALRRFAAHHGGATRYHETVTWAHLFLIHERMMERTVESTVESTVERSALESWTELAAANPDLLRWRDGAFFDRYRPEVLESELARRTFVLPRCAGTRCPR